MSDFVPFIYGLVDPLEPEHIRYVGFASTSGKRPEQHAIDARDVKTKPTYKINWIRKLHRENRNYIILKLEELPVGTTRKSCGEVEKIYIKLFRDKGHKVKHKAGQQKRWKNPQEHEKAKICAAIRWQTLGEREKASIATLKYRQDHPECAVQLVAQMHTPEAHTKNSITQTAKWKNPEFAEKQKQAQRAGWAKKKLAKAQAELIAAQAEWEALK